MQTVVIALVIANGSVKKQTAIEPLPPMPGPSPHTSRPNANYYNCTVYKVPLIGSILYPISLEKADS